MKRIYILIFVACINYSNIIAEDVYKYKQVAINFDKISSDTLDNYIKTKGKKYILKNLDSSISNLSNLIKLSSQNIKQAEIALQLKALNQHFKLNMDSSLYFEPSLNVDSSINRAYSILLGNTKQGIEFITEAKKNNFDFNTLLIENIFKPDVRNGLYIFCNYIDNVSQSALDTLYKAALIYPNDVRNEFYYALAEFDRNCGNATNNSKYYKDLLYNKMKDAMSLEKALTDTNEVSSLNYAKYILTPKYQFLAYSLYAKNFDIKANQKEIIYFLTSQNKQDGGFKEYNLEKAEKTLKSKIEPTFYGFWALLELREQINALYPDDEKVIQPNPTPKKK